MSSKLKNPKLFTSVFWMANRSFNHLNKVNLVHWGIPFTKMRTASGAVFNSSSLGEEGETISLKHWNFSFLIWFTSTRSGEIWSPPFCHVIRYHSRDYRSTSHVSISDFQSITGESTVFVDNNILICFLFATQTYFKTN